ncbi:MAG: type II secretion system protein GspG [Planctomycetota bacterium]
MTKSPMNRPSERPSPRLCLSQTVSGLNPVRQDRGSENSNRRKRRGFTLLELLLVLSILVVIGGIVVVNIGGAQAEANQNATLTQLNSLKSNIQMYKIRMNSLPETLESLRDGPSDSDKKSKWVAPIIEEIPADAWGNSLAYQVNGNEFEIRSGGIDGQLNTEDDITVSGT